MQFGNKMSRLPTETDKFRGQSSGSNNNNLLAKFENYLDNNLRNGKDLAYPQQEQHKFHSRRNSDALFGEYQDKSKVGSTTNFQSISRKSSNYSIAATLKQDESSQYKSEGVKYEKQLQRDKSGLASLFSNQQPTPVQQNNFVNFIDQMQRDLTKKNTLFSNQISRDPSPSIYQPQSTACFNSIQKKIENFQQFSSSSQKSPFGLENNQENIPFSAINRHKRNSSVQVTLNTQNSIYDAPPPLSENKKFINSIYQQQPQQQHTLPQQQQSIYSIQQNVLQLQSQQQKQIQQTQQISQKTTATPQQNTQKSSIILQKQTQPPQQQQTSINAYLPLNTNTDSLKSSMIGQYNQRFVKKASVDLRHVDLNSYMKQSNVQEQQGNNMYTPITETKTKYNINLNQMSQPQTSVYSQQNWNTNSIGNSGNFTKSSSNKENDDSYQASFNQQKKSNNDLSIFNTSRKDKDLHNPSQSNNKSTRSQFNSSNIDNLTCNFQGSKQDTKVSCEELDDSIRNILCQKINFQQEEKQPQVNGIKIEKYIDEYNNLDILKPDEDDELLRANGVEYNCHQNYNSIEEQVVFNNSVEPNQQENVEINSNNNGNNNNSVNTSNNPNNSKQISDQDFSQVKINDEISSKQIKTLSNIFKICDTKDLPKEYIEQLIELQGVISDIIAQNQ